jgi:hypothetical protein
VLAASAPADRISVEGSLLVNTIHVGAAYREAKSIYTVGPPLADCLARPPWPDKTPVVVRLPAPSKLVPHSIARVNKLSSAKTQRHHAARAKRLYSW